MSNSPFISIITPVYNGGYPFICSLLAIFKTQYTDWEMIVVDDGSTDHSVAIAQKFGAKILHTNGRKGPGAARNLGAKAAKGDYLCFIDADCEVEENTISLLAEKLKLQPQIDALFGSYDDSPAASNFVAQYKNLMHHYTHQQSSEDASTFWAGFGVVKRQLFLKLDGFDLKKYPRPSIEDIELGYRLKASGANIILAKELQVKHHKAWKIFGLMKTDIFDRGIPWTMLLLSDKSKRINDLNLQSSNRISAITSYSLLLCLLISIYNYFAIIPSLIFTGLLLSLNWDTYQFFYQKRGFWFALKVFPLHWLYYLYAGFSFAAGTLIYWKTNLTEADVKLRQLEN